MSPAVTRRTHSSIRTGEAEVNWIRRFILCHNQRHPKEMGTRSVEALLTHLAVEDYAAASTQHQALAARRFRSCGALDRELTAPIQALRAKEPQHLPAVLTNDEVHRVIAQRSGVAQLIARLLHGSGLRLLEALRLRVKDIDFERRAIIARDTEGNEDRVTTLPESVVEPLKEHLLRVKRLHEENLTNSYGSVHLSDALERNYPTPSANGPGNMSSPPNACLLTSAAETNKQAPPIGRSRGWNRIHPDRSPISVLVGLYHLLVV